MYVTHVSSQTRRARSDVSGTCFFHHLLRVPMELPLPEGKPFIVSDRERYDPGDTLRANCSLPASRPTARLSFALNNIPVRSTV
ncbi:hypothetical protein V1478_018845 [Vespula squamosa]|uniref:Uncharacterized protein n=1 Tax=Vespula squamosa TaxID=30214 RepID=A0ABD1ZTX0_VESSQ